MNICNQSNITEFASLHQPLPTQGLEDRIIRISVIGHFWSTTTLALAALESAAKRQLLIFFKKHI